MQSFVTNSQFSEFSSFMVSAPPDRDPLTRRFKHVRTAKQSLSSKMSVSHATATKYKSRSVVPAKHSFSTITKATKTVDLIAAALSKVSGENGGQAYPDPLQVAVAVERVLQQTESNSKSQANANANLRSILFNLSDSRNPDFRRKVLNGQIRPETIPTLEPEEMASYERLQGEHQLLSKIATFKL